MTKHTVSLASSSDFAGWRAWSRELLNQQVPSNAIEWKIEPPADLYAPQASRTLPEAPSTVRVPRAMGKLFPAIFASDTTERFSLLYQYLEHLQKQTPVPDHLLAQLQTLARNAEDIILSFRALMPDGHLPGWQPITSDHAASIIDSQASLLPNLRLGPWAVSAPERTLSWDGQELRFGPPLETTPSSPEDCIAAIRAATTAGPGNSYWQAPLPARLHPEPEDVRQANALSELRALALDCTFCDLCKPATRTVSGEGTPGSKLLFVGEQPGDQEDLQGRPFVGPAGQLFDRAFQEAGGDRDRTWITNAVKHFKFVPRNHRRIHQKPDTAEIQSCAPWLSAERRILRPRVTVMLGVTGASAVLGRPVTISRERSRFIELEDGSTGIVTVHPSYLLRLPDPEAKAREYTKFVTDLRMAISALAE
ncbi:UdgX family uracil-DNA binding protein [Gluconobacter morbifer]|uniref:Type-4 uracil-DNA glycosylase n=1 Tax=Gluconobacter morbifer G707 TaxID=1088869 RepID=G6XIJ0_9PROT|nr:UdgX family uracil-DNA binding protein [Gluconobacter morbifer]EHH68630.1 DNA polymerase related protein [Gluconobacter morbifer G707]